MIPSTTFPDVPTPVRRTARPSATSRPVTPAPTSDRTAPWADALRTRTVNRAKLTGTVAGLLTMVAIFLVVAPQTVMIPLAVVLVAGLTIGGLIHMVEARTRPTPVVPGRWSPVTRRDP